MTPRMCFFVSGTWNQVHLVLNCYGLVQRLSACVAQGAAAAQVQLPPPSGRAFLQPRRLRRVHERGGSQPSVRAPPQITAVHDHAMRPRVPQRLHQQVALG